MEKTLGKQHNEMNRINRVIILLSTGAVTLIWALPSWVHEFNLGSMMFTGKLGSSWIWNPPMPYATRIDWVKGVVLTCLVILLASTIIWWRIALKGRGNGK